MPGPVRPLDVNSQDTDEEQRLVVYVTLIDALRIQSDRIEVIEQLPKEHRRDTIRVVEFVENN